MKTAIKVTKLSKQYFRQTHQPYYTLRDTLTNIIKTPFSLFSRSDQDPESDSKFYALNNISFKLEPGEILGIVGRNGAGKSTLLKVLSRITPPTTGRAVINGRVGSLLEVGTGFHPELSGRENIFLSGAVLGMIRSEIRSKFNAIVDFAEIKDFLDVPVKHYSSGMYVRLAFSVAVHLEPEILFVDEVLAVGDAQFQRKSLTKMGSISQKTGRTVLFVSHNMDAIKNLCTRAIWLDQGKLIMDGSPNKVVSEYLAANQQSAYSSPNNPKKIGKITFVKIDQHKNTISINAEYQINHSKKHVTLGCIVSSIENTYLFNTSNAKWVSTKLVKPGLYRSNITFDFSAFKSGIYQTRLFLGSERDRHTYDEVGPIIINFQQNKKQSLAELNRRSLLIDASTWKNEYTKNSQ